MYFEQLRNKDNYCDSTWDRSREALRKKFSREDKSGSKS